MQSCGCITQNTRCKHAVIFARRQTAKRAASPPWAQRRPLRVSKSFHARSRKSRAELGPLLERGGGVALVDKKLSSIR
jgi:hypothetical protein